MAHNSHKRQQSIPIVDFPENPHLSCLPEPLIIRKAPSQQLPQVVHPERSEVNNPLYESAELSVFPPRLSSYSPGERDASEFLKRYENYEQSHSRPLSSSSGVRSTKSSNKSRPDSNGSTSNTMPQSNESEESAHYFSGASAEIIGDFVPLEVENVQMSGPLADVTIPYREAISRTGETYRAVNPYEFEADSPYLPTMSDATFKAFVQERPQPASGPKSKHVKNARSEGSSAFVGRALSPVQRMPSPESTDYHMARSESSPDINQRRKYPTNGLAAYCEDEDDEERASSPPQHRGRVRAPSAPTRHVPEDPRTGSNYNRDVHEQFQTPERSQHNCKTCSGELDSRSPTRSSRRRQPTQPVQYIQQPQSHGRAKSPNKHLQDVAEGDETDYSVETPTLPPPKRSRSPMKKMFGEHGWLGKTPDELPIRHKPVKAQKEKVSIIGRLRNKLGEIAEKADMSSPLTVRMHKEKPKLSVLSVSLSPAQQARILMEAELMIVHTANVFLMIQFSQGRMAVDSIKKTVDGWKSKGRPVVIEFMYDQATQRDLIAANKNNFRFHGDRAGDEVRIDSMLYNWKQVASRMTIRTFCDADTIILKLLFDIEQILEFIGAVDTLMYRLQQLRVGAVEMMRQSREIKDSAGAASANMRGAPIGPVFDDNAATLVNSTSAGAQGTRDTVSSNNTSTGRSSHSRNQSFEDAYGRARLDLDE